MAGFKLLSHANYTTGQRQFSAPQTLNNQRFLIPVSILSDTIFVFLSCRIPDNRQVTKRKQLDGVDWPEDCRRTREHRDQEHWWQGNRRGRQSWSPLESDTNASWMYRSYPSHSLSLGHCSTPSINDIDTLTSQLCYAVQIMCTWILSTRKQHVKHLTAETII